MQNREDSFPTYELGSYTLIHDKDQNQAIMRINGVVTPPVGTRIELEPDGEVYVVEVRLLAPTPDEKDAMYVCLDVSKNKPG